MAWRKSWSEQNLSQHGTKRKLTPEQRSVWDDLLDLAETSEVTGTVCWKAHIGFTVPQLALCLNTPAPIIRKALMRFASPEFDMIEYNGNGVIRIKNWKKYQSEYDRQKGYRNKLHNKVT